MSASSGIEVAQQLLDVFADAVHDGTIRFLKVIIRNGTPVYQTDVHRLTLALKRGLFPIRHYPRLEKRLKKTS